MANRPRVLVVGMVMLAVLGAVSSPGAFTPKPPHSYLRVSPNGKYVFVMLARVPVEADYRAWRGRNDFNDPREIREYYAQSGLYRRDGSKMPLWTVDWFAWGVEVASDGIHLIRHGEGGLDPEAGDEALSFFANGRLLRTYRIRDLVEKPAALPVTGFGLDWRRTSGQFDDTRLEYSVRTMEDREFVFDVRTGRIIVPADWRSQGTGQAGLGATLPPPPQRCLVM